MAQSDEYKRTGQGGGMDTESAIEDIANEDAINRQNLRNTGSQGQQLGYDVSIEGTSLLSGTLLSGINNICGGGRFNDTGQILIFRYNSNGYNQMLLYDIASNTYTVVFTDITDTQGNVPILPITPQNWVTAILVNKTYAIWWAKGPEVGYCNLKTLLSGGYGTIQPEDFSLIKPQCLIPPTGTYGSDAGQPANKLYGLLPQFIVQYVNVDYNYSCWSTRSKRFTPYQENTPVLGANVGQNNYIVVSVNIGSIRAATVNIGVQFDDSGQFYQVKSLDQAYILALPNTSVDVATEIYEAYDPSTNLYSFAFYNDTVLIPIASTETDNPYDYIWPANAGGLINGNLAAIADWTTLYARPATSVTLGAVGYNPNIAIPAGTYSDPLTKVGDFPGESGSGAGSHRRNMWVSMKGTPHTGDIIVIITADIRNAAAVRNYSYTVPSSQDGNLAAVVASISATVGGSYLDNSGTYTIYWTDISYYGLQNFSIELYFSGATVANSIPTIPDNTNCQMALFYFDKWGRRFPVCTDDSYVVTSPSYAQVNGNAIAISWQINDLNAPAGAVSYQWGITKPAVTKILDTTGCTLNFKGAWDARTNIITPPGSGGLSINSGNIGDTWQITTPCSPVDTADYTNLGTNATYNTGDYVTNVGGASSLGGYGLYYAVLPKSFGNIGTAGTGGILCFSLNPLQLLNSQYNQENVNTNLVYDFAQGDRCTLHYWIDSAGNINYFNVPCIDLAVLGYDAGTNIVKLENSAALTYSDGNILYNGVQINARNVFMRLYSPQPLTQGTTATQSTQEWLEIGEQFAIVDGQHSVLNGTITDGGAYYKTRQFPDAPGPFANPPVHVLATDLNYSDYYPSAYYSFGRVRTYYDELEQTEQAASIITSQTYILGSKINGLNRFYRENIYGEGNGQTSSSKGAIQILDQKGSELLVGQELGIFRIPVNIAYQQLNTQLTGIAISEKLFNNGRYDDQDVGLGTNKGWCSRYGTRFLIDPNKSLPFELTDSGAIPISGKMDKYFKSTIQLAYSLGKKILLYYDDYYEELICAIQAQNGVLVLIPFDGADWNPFNSYDITGADVSATPDGTHCTASYDASTGKVTYTPTTDYTGDDSATFTFNPGSGDITKKNCLTWIAGTSTVNPFSFIALLNQALSTVVYSNIITVTGPNIPVAISITGGEYSVNGGAYTSSAGTVNANDTVQVRQTTSASNSTETDVVLTIGTESGTFAATTLASGAGAYNVYAQYGATITSVADGTCTGTPTDYASISLTPGMQQRAVYTTIVAGTVKLIVTGMPAIPGHTQFYLSVAGTTVDTTPFTGPGTYYLTFSSDENSPTAIEIGVQTTS